MWTTTTQPGQLGDYCARIAIPRLGFWPTPPIKLSAYCLIWKNMPTFQDRLLISGKGLKQFPLAPNAKFPPLRPGWKEDATIATPVDWPPDANIGINCEGHAVIDIDPSKGGNESFLALELENELPDTLTSLTPGKDGRRGRHLFFRLPKGHPGVRNSVGALGEGLDVRSTGGYVVGAGSRTPAGEYKWLNPNVPIAPVPKWLLERMGQAVPKSADVGIPVPDADETAVERARGWLDTRPGAVEGSGGDLATFQVAAFLRDFGLSPKQAYDLMLNWNARCSPPWGPDDLWAKVENAYRYADGQAGAKAVTADDFPNVAFEPVALTTYEQPRKVDKRIPTAMKDIAAGPSTASGYVIKGLLLKRSYAMLYGAPGEGKTFVALDMAYHVAAGKEWMGKRVRQGDALYVGFEAYGGLANRARALRQKYGDDVALYFVGGGFDLRQPEGRRAFGEILAALPRKPVLIVYDTFAYALAGGDENSAQDVGSFNSAVQALIEATDACVLLVHHTGKDANKGARGSSALPAAIDTELAIAERTITPTKQREIELGEPIGFQLTPVMIGSDEDGDGIMSCVVDPGVVTADRPRAKRGNEERVLDELIRLSPNNEPIGYVNLLEACIDFLPTGDTRRRATFKDAINGLEKKGIVQNVDGMVSRIMV